MRKFFFTLVAMLLLGTAFTGALAWWGHVQYQNPGPLTESKTLLIPKGSGLEAIAAQLAQENVISQPLIFKAATILSGERKHFKAGEYEFLAGISMRDVIALIASGKVVIHKVTVPEGTTVLEVKELLAAEPRLTGDVPADIPEGSLLPETYHFTYGDSREGMIARMQDGMRKVVQELWAGRAEGLPIGTPHEALTLASIIERETSLPEEYTRVAAVYINRLRINMRLQADPTVIYGITPRGKMERSLTYKDLETPTPYNTYTNAGLPPTPIANPGRGAIAAALNPASTKEIFFVADGKGGHVFAETYAEHTKNVAAFRAKMREKEASAM